MEVLLVEDSPGDVRLTQEAFRDANGTVNLHVASDGVEAMAFLRREGNNASSPRPDLILLDLGLPAGSGTVVLERLRNLSTTSFTPVIVVTGRFVDLDGKQILREFGCETVLRKPVTSDQLIAAVTDALTARLSSGDASEALDR